MYEKVTAVYNSAQEIQKVSNISHNIWGICLFLVATLILLVSYNYRKAILMLVIPFFLVLMELGFLGYIFFNKGLDKTFTVGELILTFPEIYVHLFMAATTIIGSMIELLYIRGKVKNQLFVLAFPAIFVILGFLNVVHPHGGSSHDTGDALFHSFLGIFFVTTGIFFLIGRLSKKYQKQFMILGCASLMAAGVMLSQYREIASAYQYAFLKPIAQNEYVDKGDFAEIKVLNDSVDPKDIKIKKGGSVIFIFLGAGYHEISSGPHPTHTEYAPLNLDVLKQGDVKTVKFPKSGLYGYHDHLLEDTLNPIQGTILVID